VLSVAIGLALTVGGWVAARWVAGAWSLRLTAALLLDELAPFAGFLVLIALTARPVFAGAVIGGLFAGFAFADRVKRQVLREPIVFTDMSELYGLFRHPQLYLPFVGTGRVTIGAGIVAASLAVLLWEEPIAFAWSPGLAALALTAPVAAIWLSATRLVAPLAQALHRLDPTGDPIADASRFGPLATLGIYGLIARSERVRRRAAVMPPPAAITRRSTDLPPLVLVQAESFFDARRLHPGIAADLLPAFDTCRSGALQSGLLDVPCWGANSTRTEFAVLTGLSDDALGFDRFNPYHAFAKAPIASLAWRLKARGYRTICVHPFDRRYYARDRIIPLLGFDAFLGEEAFAGKPRKGRYIADTAIAEVGLELLREHRGKGLFVFAITMGNHGPWDKSSTVAELPPSLARARDGVAFGQFLHGLRDTDAMLDVLHNGLADTPALLALYGDHLPSLPGAFAALGFTDPRTDYLIWRGGFGPGLRRDLAAHQLRDVLLEALLGDQLRAGLISHTPARIAAAMTPGTTASQVPAAANAPVPAQIVDDSASAIVAMRDEVCRRRK
jgi:hypothetical protein